MAQSPLNGTTEPVDIPQPQPVDIPQPQPVDIEEEGWSPAITSWWLKEMDNYEGAGTLHQRVLSLSRRDRI